MGLISLRASGDISAAAAACQLLLRWDQDLLSQAEGLVFLGRGFPWQGISQTRYVIVLGRGNFVFSALFAIKVDLAAIVACHSGSRQADGKSAFADLLSHKDEQAHSGPDPQSGT